MDNTTEIIELKFEGNGINPAKVRASEIAELIRNFEEAIISIVKENHPELIEDEVLISFEEIKNESIDIKCLATRAKEIIIPAYLLIATAFSSNNFNDLPTKTIENLRAITRFAKRHNCDGALIRENLKIATFQSNTEITLDESRFLKGETTIYGVLQKIGGETPRITLKIKDSYSVSFELKKELAIQLSSKLYKEIGLVGNAKWDKKTYQIIDFRPESIINFEAVPISETFKDLSKVLGKYYKNIDDFNAYINDV